MFRYDWDWVGAEKEFKRAIELNPGYATAHQWYSGLLSALGRIDESIAEQRRALELDPLSLIINRDLGRSYCFARRYSEAIEQELKTLDMDPNFLPALGALGHAYIQESMFDDAIAAFQKASKLESRYRLHLGITYAFAGRREDALSILREQEGLMERTYVLLQDTAIIHAALEEKDLAFEWLEKAFEYRAPGLADLKTQPLWDPLRSDTRFQDLLRRMNFSE